MKKRILLLAAALCLLCSGCGGGLLEREWSSVTPHSAGYWENGDKDTLRADSYQDAVNAILMLVANHAERGVVRCYFGSDAEYAELAAEACNEVQQETDLGAYLLDYITYAGTDERGFYELSLSFGYRRGDPRPAARRGGGGRGPLGGARELLFHRPRGRGADGPRRAGGEGRRKRHRYTRRAVAGQLLPGHGRTGHRGNFAEIKEGEAAMWSMIWPIALVVGVNVFYHITTKSTPEGVNAFASLTITYLVGAAFSVAAFYLMGNRDFIGELGKTNWTAWALGAIIVGLEFGTICVYRAGWKISVASLIANITLACVLLAVGLLVYHETVSLRQGLGVLVCLAGIYLVGA